MPSRDRLDVVRDTYRAFETGDRQLIEELIGADFEFFSPPDPGLDRDGFFERCWPNAGHIASFELVRLVENGDEVVVTYEARREDGSRFRNTEILTVRDGRLRRTEVYFGWDL